MISVDMCFKSEMVCYAAVATTLAMFLCSVIWVRRGGQLPPGPSMALPIIGHMHLLGPLAHKSLHRLSKQYGPIFYLRLGSIPTVVISSPSLAKQFFQHHDEACAFRPTMEFGKNMFYDQTSGLMQPNDPRWKAVRRLFVQEVFSPKSMLCSKHVRDEEICLLLQQVQSRAQSGECVEIRTLALDWILNVTCRMLFSERVSAEGELPELPRVLNVVSELFAKPLIGDFVPYLRWLDPGGLRKKVIMQAKNLDEILQNILNKRLQQRHACELPPADLLTIFLDFFGITTGNPSECAPVKAAILDVLLAGTDTTTAAIEWAMVELLCAPKAKMVKVQEEIRAVVEAGKQVEEAHVQSLSYLQALVKETLRLHPPAPLLLPHVNREQPIQMAGFRLPTNTRLILNAWSIGRDESLWDAAHEFTPERFLEGGPASQVSYFGTQSGQSDHMLIPFGRGRRACPGGNFALTMVSLFVANLVHTFEWQSSISTIPEEEVMGISNMLAQPFQAKPSRRF